MVIEDKFFELLQLAVGTRECFSEQPTAEEWPELVEMFQKQSLLGIGYRGVSQAVKNGNCQTASLPFLTKWSMRVDDIPQKNAELDKDASILTRIFEKEGFDVCILKGQGIARLYPDPSLRTSGDIDAWVWPQDDSNNQTLSDRRKTIVAYCKRLVNPKEIVYHHMPFPINGKDIEVHFTPSWMYAPSSNCRLQRFFEQEWEHREWYGVNEKLGFYVPSLKMDRVFILVHIYRHLFAEGIGLRQLLDYYYVLKATNTDEERADCLMTLKDIGMGRFTAATMWVLQTVFGLDELHMLCKPNEKEGRFLLHEIMATGNFGHYDERYQISQEGGSSIRFGQVLLRNLRFLTSYPREILSMPFWKIGHQLWMHKHGYNKIK